MTPLRAICTALAPADLERSPPLPPAPRQVLSALHHCRSGSEGPRLSPGPPGARPPRGQPACGPRPCPQCQQPPPPPWLQPHLAHPLPGPHGLRTLTVPATLRPCLRAPQRRASHALLQASATARTRRAHDERVVGTDRPGCTGVLPPWGRPRQDHPPRHAMVPGGGLAKDRTGWGPSRATCLVPVTARAPLSRARCTAARPHAGLLEPSAPQGGTLPGHGHRQAQPHGSSACTSRAPSVCTVASAHRRLVGLLDRPGPCTSRPVGRARLRPPPLDVLALLRRCLPPVWPDGCVTVRHCGVRQARGAVPLATRRRRLGQGRPRDDQPPRRPPPRVATVRPGAARCTSSCGGGPLPRPWPETRWRGMPCFYDRATPWGGAPHGTRAPTGQPQAGQGGASQERPRLPGSRRCRLRLRAGPHAQASPHREASAPPSLVTQDPRRHARWPAGLP